MTKRTDPHRKGAIIPGEYSHVISYNLATSQDGRPVPSLGVNCELDRRQRDPETGEITKAGEHNPDGLCCVVGLHHVARVKFAEHGGTGKCTACGSRFIYGEVWRHDPTGEHIHIGHICGAKYGLLVDRSAFELEAGRRRKAAAVQIQREEKAKERAEFLVDQPGLEEALKTDHPIVQDIAAYFQRNCYLSSRQIALVQKLHAEANAPEPEPEKHVAAPEGRQTFRGRVVSVKSQEGDFGWSTKMTIKVETPDGNWFAWGTAPAALLETVEENGLSHQRLRGCEVELTATLKRSDRDQHFAFYKRPTKPRLLARPESDSQ